jgi:EmrB/QacA subfamily drug resistance transporter
VVVSTFSFVIAFNTSSVNIALPSMGNEFAMEAVLLGWVNTAMIMAVAAVLIPAGRLADIYGRKKIFFYGTILFAISSFSCAMANSSPLIIAFRALQGISGGMTIGPSIAILTSVFPANERGRALGISVAAVYVGLTAGPFLGGVLTQYLGWRSIFFLSAGLSVPVVALISWKLRGEWAESAGEKFDLAGSLTFILALVMTLYGLTVLPGITGIALIAVGALGIFGFVRWEAKAESPVLNINLLGRNKVFILSNAANLITYSATYAVVFLLSLYLQYIKVLSPQTTGLIILIQSAIMAVASPFAGRLSDKIEPQIVASAGMALNCVALLLLVFLTEQTSPVFIIISMVIFGFGMGLFVSPNTNAVLGSVPKKTLGVASGVQAAMRNVGMVFSMGIVMILFSIYIGQVQIAPEYYPAFLSAMRVGFVIFAVLCFLGIFIQITGRETHKT